MLYFFSLANGRLEIYITTPTPKTIKPPKVNAASALSPLSESAGFKACGGVKKKQPAIMANPTTVITSPKFFIYYMLYGANI